MLQRQKERMFLFLLEWTDDGEVVVTRKGSTGYSDFDEFTENETFIDNSYYQVG